MTHLANPVFIGTPAGTAKAFVHEFGTSLVTVDLSETLYETTVGLVIGVVAGIASGLFLSHYRMLRTALVPMLAAFNSVPRIALAPLFALWLGLGAASKIALVVSFVFFIMLTTTMAALTQPNQDFELLSATLGATARQRLLYFTLPTAIPTLAAGLELSLVYAFLGAVAGEIISGSHGLGVRLTIYANAFELNRFFGVLILLGLVSTLSVQVLRLMTSRLTRWHAAEKGE